MSAVYAIGVIMAIFITIEGPNGVGKTSFIKKLKENLSDDYLVFTTKEPSNSEFGNYVKKNENCLHGMTYAYLIAADRCYHLEKYIEPALNTNDIFISDRYIESSLVLQKYDGVTIEDIWRLNCKFRIPDLSIILLSEEKNLEDRLNEREKLSYFESKITRYEEIEGYVEAATFLKNKGFNIVLLNNNTQKDLYGNINIIERMIVKLREKNE